LALVTSACGLFRAKINSSPDIRWWLFSHFGADKMCPEMLKHGAPLTLLPGGNTLGRFFPNSCQSVVNDSSQTVTVNFGGTGYAWTPIAGRVGFSMQAAVEYRPDFRLEEDAMYVFARMTRVVNGPNFALGAVENPVVDWASRTPAGYLATTFGNQIVQSQLASGFTVVRSDSGDDFTLGILTPPARPTHPFALKGSDRVTLANETTEVRANQVDFVGPLEVADSGQALYLKTRLTGPAVDALVIPRSVADPWREGLQQGTAVSPPAGSALATLVIQPSAPNAPGAEQRIPLPPGQYYLVLDNSNRVGSVAPPWTLINALGASTAVVSCAVELGDAD
jgi:hypothetical protein